MFNERIRRKMQHNGVRAYELAPQIGISESSVYRWLRNPLTQERETLVLDAIHAVLAKRPDDE